MISGLRKKIFSDAIFRQSMLSITAARWYEEDYSRGRNYFRLEQIMLGTVFIWSVSSANSDNDSYPRQKITSLESLQRDLQTTLGKENVEVDLEERKIRGKPWNSYHKCQNNPDIVVFPKSTKDVSDIMKLCHKYNIPVIPFGGGTSVEGQTLALSGGVSIDFSHMKRILEFNKEDLDCTVEAGLGYIELNDVLRGHGLWFPLDPGPGATVGGMCACRCSGSTAVRYGSMRENVLNVTAVLADGTIFRTGGRARKSSAGYDVTRLLIGSEGTLAVITEVTHLTM